MDPPLIKLARIPSRRIAGTSIADKIRTIIAPPGSTLGLQSDNMIIFARSLVSMLRLSDSISLIVGGTDPAPGGYDLVGVLVNVGKAGIPGHASCFTRINNTWYYMDSDAGVKQTIKYSASEFVVRANSERPLIEASHPVTGSTMISDIPAERIRFFVKRTVTPVDTISTWLLGFFYDNSIIESSNYSGSYIPSQSGATCVFDSVNNILFLADGIRGKIYNILRTSGLDQRIRATPRLEDTTFDAFVEAEVALPNWSTVVANTSEEERKMLRVFILMALRMYDIEQAESTHSNANKNKLELNYYIERSPGLDMMMKSLQATSPRFRSLNIGDVSKISDTDILRKTELQDTYLHLAALYNIPAWIEPLVRRGVDINSQNAMGFTPIHFAIDQGHIEFVRELLVHHADVNRLNRMGFSPRRLAIERNRLDILKLLDSNGANTKQGIFSGSMYEPPMPMNYYVSILIDNGRHELRPILAYLKGLSGGRRIQSRRRRPQKNRSRNNH